MLLTTELQELHATFAEEASKTSDMVIIHVKMLVLTVTLTVVWNVSEEKNPLLMLVKKIQESVATKVMTCFSAQLQEKGHPTTEQRLSFVIFADRMCQISEEDTISA